MKLLISLFLILCSVSVGAQIEWLSWEEAVRRQQTEPRKLLVDVYTDWCGWCKEMDKKVFAKPAIAKYINDNFYAVKLNAEGKESITFDGHVFAYDPEQGRRGVHALAVALLDGQMSFPSIVYLDERTKRISVSPGYKPADTYLNELTYIAEGHWRRVSYQEYLSEISK
jgi:thioredoxin-related protein